MVRKRSRTSRKHYDDENDSEDSDFALDDVPSEPVKKKYSLRQRKRRIFTEFEFDDDGEEIEPTRGTSDDEDFEVEKELALAGAPSSPDTNSNHQPAEAPEDGEGLIDFEDIIRADIVVNKNRIDYDNVIEKTEIKVHPMGGGTVWTVKPKRGRKSKIALDEDIDSSLLEPETEMLEEDYDDSQDNSDNPEPIDCAQLMQAELSESLNEIENTPESKAGDDTASQEVKQCEDTSLQSPKVKTQEFPCTVNGTGNLNGKASSPLQSNNTQAATTNVLGVDDDDDDDDVVLIEDEKKCEVIVLDD